MKPVSSLIIVLLVISMLTPATLKATNINTNNDLFEYSVYSSELPKIKFPLRDIESAFNNEVLTIHVRGGLLESLHYASLYGYIAIKFNESIIENEDSFNILRTNWDYCELHYLGYSIITKAYSHLGLIRAINLASHMLQGRKTLVHIIHLDNSTSGITLSFKMKTYPPLRAVIKYPQRGVILDFGTSVLTLWYAGRDNITVEVTVLKRDEILVNFRVGNSAFTSSIELLLTIDNDISSAIKKAEESADNWRTYIGYSATYFQQLLSGFPRMNTADKTIEQMYYLSILTKINYLSKNGISVDGINYNIIDIWSSAFLLPFIKSYLYKVALFNSLNNYVMRFLRENNAQLKIDEVAILGIILDELYWSTPELRNSIRSIYTALNDVMIKIAENLSSGVPVIGTSIVPDLGDGEYSVTYGFLAGSMKAFSRLSKEFGGNYVTYLNAYNAVMEYLNKKFLKGDHYIYAILSNGTIVDNDEYLIYTIILMLEDVPNWKTHLAYVLGKYSSILHKLRQPINSLILGIIPYVFTLKGYPDEAYSMAVYSYMLLMKSITKSYEVNSPNFDLLVIKGFAGLNLKNYELELRPAMPLNIKELSIDGIEVASKLITITIRGAGTQVRKVLVNNELYLVPFIPVGSLRDFNTVIVELEEEPITLLRVRVLRNGYPLTNTLVYALINNSRKLMAITNIQGEVVFEVPRNSEVVVTATYRNFSVSLITITTLKEQEIAFTFPIQYSQEENNTYLNELEFIRSKIQKLENSVAELESKIRNLQESLNNNSKEVPNKISGFNRQTVVIIVCLIIAGAALISGIPYLRRRFVKLKLMLRISGIPYLRSYMLKRRNANNYEKAGKSDSKEVNNEQRGNKA